MKRVTATTIAAFLAIAAASPAIAQSVTVLHGTATEARAEGVEILRGTPVVKKTVTRYMRPAYRMPFMVAGETLWYRGARTGRLYACWVQGTGYVGQLRIRCTSSRRY